MRVLGGLLELSPRSEGAVSSLRGGPLVVFGPRAWGFAVLCLYR